MWRPASSEGDRIMTERIPLHLLQRQVIAQKTVDAVLQSDIPGILCADLISAPPSINMVQPDEVAVGRIIDAVFP